MIGLISAFAVASASRVVLVVESTDKSLDGKGISNIHFGAAINGALISDTPITYIEDGPRVWQDVQIADGFIPFVLQEGGNVLVAAAGNSSLNARPIDGYLTINGTADVFYACSQLAWDPYHYASAENPGVGVYSASETHPDKCTPIKIRAEVRDRIPIPVTRAVSDTPTSTEVTEVPKVSTIGTITAVSTIGGSLGSAEPSSVPSWGSSTTGGSYNGTDNGAYNGTANGTDNGTDSGSSGTGTGIYNGTDTGAHNGTDNGSNGTDTGIYNGTDTGTNNGTDNGSSGTDTGSGPDTSTDSGNSPSPSPGPGNGTATTYHSSSILANAATRQAGGILVAALALLL